MPFNLSLDQLRQRTSAKWREAPEDVIPMWVAEMDVSLAEPVVRAVCDAMAAGDTGYATGTDYAEALLDFADRRWGWSGIDVSRTALVPDVMQGVVEVLKLISPPHAGVVVTSPVYPPFFSFVEHMDRRIIEAPLGPDGRLDFATLEAAFAERPAAFLLANPHNPTGAVHTAGELAQVASLADRYQVRVIADEVHAPLVLPGARFVPYLSVAGTANAFSIMSATKGWNLAGLKAALLIVGEEASADLARLPEEVSHGPSHLGVIAHAAAYRLGGDWLDDLLAGLDNNRLLFGELLREHLPEVRWAPPQATYLAWLDCRPLGLAEPANGARGNVRASEGPAVVFLEKARVLVTAGSAFGRGGAGHVRVNFGTSPAVLREALARLGSLSRRS